MSQQWVARYNGADSLDDIANAIDLQGNVYVTGTTDSNSTDYNMLTLKYNAAGTQLWAKTYTSTGGYNDIARAITVDADSNVYIAGEAYPGSAPMITTLSYAADGTLRWFFNETAVTNTTAKCIALDHAGNVIVGGTALATDGTTRYAVMKFSNTGTSLWVKTYGYLAIPTDVLTAIAVDTANNIYATGYMNNSSNNDFATVKFNSSGVQQWVETYNNSGYNDTAYSNTIDNNGNIIVAGFSQTTGGNDVISVISYKATGTPNWTKTYSGDAHDYAYKVLCDNANNVYVCGYEGNSSSSGLLLLKYSSSGNLLWHKTSLSDSLFVFKSAAIDNAANLYLTGTTKLTTSGYTYITTQKLDSSGNIQWTISYNGPSGHNRNNIPGQIMVSENGNVYVCGASDSTGTGYDFSTIKYSQCLSTAPLLKIRTTNTNASANTLDTLNENSFIKVIPNPNNGNMHVVYKNPGNTTGTFNVYNIMGKQVLSYPLNIGTNTLIISRTDLDPGIYFYRAIAGNKLLGKDKIVIIK